MPSLKQRQTSPHDKVASDDEIRRLHAAREFRGASELLAETHGPRLRGFLRKKLSSVELGDEIWSKTMEAAAKSIERYSGTSPPSAWLRGIAKNVLKNYFRELGRRPSAALEPGEFEARLESWRRRESSSEQRPSRQIRDFMNREEAFHLNASGALEALFGTLPPKEHALLEKLYEGKSEDAVAMELNIEKNSVRVYRKRALDHINDVIDGALAAVEGTSAACEGDRGGRFLQALRILGALSENES